MLQSHFPNWRYRDMSTRDADDVPALMAYERLMDDISRCFDTSEMEAIRQRMEAADNRYGANKWSFYRPRLQKAWRERYQRLAMDSDIRTVHVQVI